MSTPAIQELRSMLTRCRLCPRRCGVNRAAGERGACGVGMLPTVASCGPHFGEEDVLVGSGGSGTIFFSGCNLACVFCQNHDISQRICGREMPPAALADVMLMLQRRGCENANLVTPTHVAHAVAEAIALARDRGLAIPVVYNCGGYESAEVLGLLAGLIEIYMPDFKYADAEAGLRYSGVRDYPRYARAALAEMYRQVGPLRTDERGVAVRGVLVRHLVMPNDIAGGRKVIDIVAETAPGTAINIMAQYHPAHRAFDFPELLGRVRAAEVQALREHAAARGLRCVGP
jgi:putative pyruvate formate lyase activating enzyme